MKLIIGMSMKINVIMKWKYVKIIMAKWPNVMIINENVDNNEDVNEIMKRNINI